VGKCEIFLNSDGFSCGISCCMIHAFPPFYKRSLMVSEVVTALVHLMQNRGNTSLMRRDMGRDMRRDIYAFNEHPHYNQGTADQNTREKNARYYATAVHHRKGYFTRGAGSITRL